MGDQGSTQTHAKMVHAYPQQQQQQQLHTSLFLAISTNSLCALIIFDLCFLIYYLGPDSFQLLAPLLDLLFPATCSTIGPSLSSYLLHYWTFSIQLLAPLLDLLYPATCSTIGPSLSSYLLHYWTFSFQLLAPLLDLLYPATCFSL